jgi:NAD(P)-dependent dehydrogenase (short-subunit alcohol dehydrogenase family)
VLLEKRVALIYGAGGSIGSAVARGLAREGAHVCLAGRTASTVERVAAGIRADGGSAEAASVDALDEDAVTRWVDGVAERAGRIDVSFNAIAANEVFEPLLDISVEDFMRPIDTYARGHFITTRAAARHMIARRSGVVLAFGGSGSPRPGLGGFMTALDVVESLRRQWTAQLGPHGIRVVTLRTSGIMESVPADLPGRDRIEADVVGATLFKRTPTLDEIGHVAAFLASDHAVNITGTQINITAGAEID